MLYSKIDENEDDVFFVCKCLKLMMVIIFFMFLKMVFVLLYRF